MDQSIFLRRIQNASLVANAWVAELLMDGESWNEEALHENFDETQISMIKITHVDASLGSGDHS